MAKLRPSAPNVNVPYTLDKAKPLLNPYHSHGYSDISFGSNLCLSNSLLLLSTPPSPFQPLCCPINYLCCYNCLSEHTNGQPTNNLAGKMKSCLIHLILPTGLKSGTKRRAGVSGIHTSFTTNRWSVQPCPTNYIRNMIHWES